MFRDYYDYLREDHPAEFAAIVAEDRQRFGDILDDALSAARYRPPRHAAAVLSVGCGHCVEAPVVVDRFSNPDVPATPRIFGIDELPQRIAAAKHNAAGLPGDHVFITGDAARLDDYPEIPPIVDAMISRRQNIGVNPDEWAEIFGQAIARLRLGGIAVVTSLTEREHAEMRDVFRSMGYEPDPRVSAVTRYERQARYEDIGKRFSVIDSHVAVFRQWQ